MTKRHSEEHAIELYEFYKTCWSANKTDKEFDIYRGCSGNLFRKYGFKLKADFDAERLEQGLKICSKCNSTLSLDMFYKEAGSLGNVSYACKDCIRTKERARYDGPSEKRRDESRKWKKDNPERSREIKARYRRKNAASLKAYVTRRRLENPEYSKEYNADNRIRLNKAAVERRKNDIQSKLKCNMRSRMSQALREHYKRGSAVEDLGCSIESLMDRFEHMFYPNTETGEMMSWDNYGMHGWHIDHIKPLDSFNLSNRDEFLKACNYDNLQPMWAKDNLHKGAKISEEFGNA